MKITGGSFGNKGSVYVAGTVLAVDGVAKKDYRAGEIAAVNARTEKARRFGLLGFLIGAAQRCSLGWVF